MPPTPDRKPGRLEEDDELFFVPNTTPPSEAGAMNYDGTSFQMKDSLGTFDPRSGSASFDDIVLDDFGRIVYVGNGVFVMRG
jgi:hypothetical protein